MAQLTPLMRGYQNIFQYVGIFIWFPLHETMVWYLAIGSGIPTPSDALDVCVSKHQSALIGGDGDPTPPQGRRPEDIGRRAEERKPSFLAQARKTTSSELRAKRSAHGGRSERSERWVAPEDL